MREVPLDDITDLVREGGVNIAKQACATFGHTNFLTLAEAAGFSGHKLHVYCEDVGDVAEVLDRVWPVVEARGLGCKAGTSRLFGHAEDDPQRNKGVTIWLPRRDTDSADIDAVVETLDGYAKDRPIPGDVYVGNGVSRRFDLARDIGRDRRKESMFKEYRPAQPGVAYREGQDLD